MLGSPLSRTPQLRASPLSRSGVSCLAGAPGEQLRPALPIADPDPAAPARSRPPLPGRPPLLFALPGLLLTDPAIFRPARCKEGREPVSSGRIWPSPACWTMPKLPEPRLKPPHHPSSSRQPPSLLCLESGQRRSRARAHEPSPYCVAASFAVPLPLLALDLARARLALSLGLAAGTPVLWLGLGLFAL